MSRYSPDRGGQITCLRSWRRQYILAAGIAFCVGGGLAIPHAASGQAPAKAKQDSPGSLYDNSAVPTISLTFPTADWEAKMEELHKKDEDLLGAAAVGGVTYRDVGAGFRGSSSFFMVKPGWKRSIKLKFDRTHDDQALGGYRTLNLLNATGDPTFLRAWLYSRIARAYIPAPKVSFVRLQINGENWGIYPNQQQFNREFLVDFFGQSGGARWKVPGSPVAKSGLEYWGNDLERYKKAYEIDTKDDPESWQKLIELSRVLNETPTDKLEAALKPILNIDGVLRFLALDVALVNTDGYWTRSSDYNIYLDPAGRFHILPHDMNEAFSPARPGAGPGFMTRGGFPGGPRPPGAPGAPGGPRPPGAPPVPGAATTPGAPAVPGAPAAQGAPAMPPEFAALATMEPAAREAAIARMRAAGEGSPRLDPLVAINDNSKPLRSRLLAVPALRKRYLEYVLDIATKQLDWKTLSPTLRRAHDMIAADVRADMHKLYNNEEFASNFDGEKESLKSFIEQRQAYLLEVVPGLIKASGATK